MGPVYSQGGYVGSIIDLVGMPLDKVCASHGGTDKVGWEPVQAVGSGLTLLLNRGG
jgi:hypothetical protein